jgi:hypothetical protein
VSKGWASRRVFASKRAQAQRREGWRKSRLGREAGTRCFLCGALLGAEVWVLVTEASDGGEIAAKFCSAACELETSAALREIMWERHGVKPRIDVRFDA